jgi:NAD(P)-dependent dehydrogenase (short-subunit alcohol dehydrogenase family)
VDRSGRWGPDDIRDLTGRVAVVTGANSGIGYEAAVELAAHGAHMVLACRDRARGLQAVDRIMGAAPWATAETVPLDLARLASVREAAARIGAEHGRLDLLVNNAGVMATPFGVTEDGFERQMATNHLGHFALTGLLLDLLLTTGGSRVVTVSSHVHRIGRLVTPSAGPSPAGYSRWLAYANSKLANLYFTYELDRRLRAAGATTLAVAAHPGWARSNLAVNGPATGGSALRARAGAAATHLGQSAAAGALPTLFAATDPAVVGGRYYGPSGPLGCFGSPGPARSSRRSHRADEAARLWAASEEATGVRFDLDPVAVPAP